MRFIVLGCGSIGQRHIKNLLALDHSVLAQDTDTERLESVGSKYHIPTFSSEELVLNEAADAALVCSPSSYHVLQALKVAERGMHIFVEKPLSHTLAGTEALAEIAEEKGLVLLVACNLRFFPSLRLIKELVDEGRVGRLLLARINGGFYLPYWRPETDYRQGYGARAELGGGVILDFAHDLDYLRWFFGHPSQVFCWADKLSSLDIDTEDIASIQFKFPNGALAQLQFDYLQPTYRRSMELIGEEGTIVWDYVAQTVHLYGRDNNRCQVYLENINSELNSMYVQEMEHFIRCIEGSEQPMVDAREGRAVVELVEAARLSSQEGRVVSLPLEPTP